MKLKVLPNDMQKALEFHERMMKRGNPLGRREKFDLFEYYKDHPVVFNRVGYYLTPTDCWMEFRLNDGTFKAINYDRHSFRWSLATAIAKDNPIPDKDWEMIKCLIQRKLLRWEERYIKESERRQFRRTEVDAKKWGLGVRKRMESKIEQRKAEQKLKAETSDNKT